MSYVKQNFTKGQILSYEHLNHMEDGIEAACAASGSSGANVIILETTSGDNRGKYYYYNGEVVAVDFLTDCLMSGYQVIIKDTNLNIYYSMYGWVKDDRYNELIIYTKDNSHCPKFDL